MERRNHSNDVPVKLEPSLSTAGAPMVPVVARPLLALAAVSLVWLVVCLALQLVDGRQVLGVSTWAKPAKFAASIGLTSVTLAWLLNHIQLSGRAARRVVAILVASFSLELVIISVQAARGVPSHFNNATAVDGLLFTVMGIGIVVATVALAFVAVRAFRQRFADAALGWGIRLGFVAMLVGSSVGGLMPRPTADQLMTLRAGGATPLLGAHSVGVSDGGAGLPLAGWNKEGGDLRVAHFLGLHGLQVLPVVGWLVGRRRRRTLEVGAGLGAPGVAANVAIVGVAYIGLVVVTLVQALRGQPLLRPDAATLVTVLGVLALGAAAAALVHLQPWGTGGWRVQRRLNATANRV